MLAKCSSRAFFELRVCSFAQAQTVSLESIGPCVELEGELIHSGCQVISTFTGISFFKGTVKNEGGEILKSDSVDGMVPVMRC